MPSDESIVMRDKCLHLGEQAWLNGDTDKAVRMFEKSLRFGNGFLGGGKADISVIIGVILFFRFV